MGSRKTVAGLLPLLLVLCPVLVRAADEEPAPAVEASPSADAGELARTVVESFHRVLLGCMKQADELGFSGRYERISAGLGEAFDLPLMARVAVGATWKELGEQERADFVELSRRYSAAKYAHGFNGYGGERFDTLSHEPAARATIVVKTMLVQPKDDDVRFDYRLRKTGDGWRIIDIELDAKVSELALRRAQYRSLIEKDGYPHLVESMEEKIVELSRE